MTTRTPWDIVQQEFTCDHSTTEFRILTMSNGRPQFVKQCMRCGKNCGAVRKDTIPGLQRMNLKGFDVELHKGWQDGMVRRLQEVREQDSDHWWRLYNRYLESPEWKAKRRAVLERDSFVCQGCQNARATQVHHLTYKRKGREMLFDLVAVCDDCHCEIHAEESSEE